LQCGTGRGTRRGVAEDAPRRRTIAWVSSTYFAEGLPYMIVRILSGVYFTDAGAKERYIGYLNFLGLPWNFKFLWAPLLDSLGTKRRWLVILQALVGVLTLAVAAICLATPSAGDPSRPLLAVALIFVGMAFAAATNDIAIDGYYLEGLADQRTQAAYSGYRVMAYRIAMVFARSGLVAVAAYAGSRAGVTPHLAWAYAFGAGGATMLALAALHGLFLPRFEAEAKAKQQAIDVLRSYGRAFVTYLQQDRVVRVLAFIILYKLGDDILFSMVTPFLMRELQVTKGQYAWIGGIVGAAGSIVGAMAGGKWIERRGLEKTMWPLTLLMNLNIWAYVYLAWAKPDPTTLRGIGTIAAIHGYEQIAAGLGSAALLVFLLRTCKPEHKAGHYAIGSAIMSIGSSVVGGYGGRLVESIGYLCLFMLAFAASIPSMLLLPFVPLGERKV
jgi:PAT family beta-lactamase induction signal transducer AmpG